MGQSQKRVVLDQSLVKALRKEHRIDVSWPALIRVGGSEAGQELECEILNVSLNGVKIHLEMEIVPGTEVELEISNFTALTGRTVWSLVDRAGIVLNGNPDTIKATIFSRARLEEEGGAEMEIKTKATIKPRIKTKSKPKAKPKPKAKAKAKAKSKSKAKPKTKSKAKSKAKS